MPAQRWPIAVSPAYVAGFLDGEGNITILARNRYLGRITYGLHVGFTNRDVRVLLAIRAIYGGNLLEKRRSKPQHSAAYELRVGRRADVARLLADTLPHLIIKREQAELGLAFLALGRVRRVVIRRYQTIRGSAPHLVALPGQQEMRAELKRSLNELNARGVACQQSA